MILLTGASGKLGGYLIRQAQLRGQSILGVNRLSADANVGVTLSAKSDELRLNYLDWPEFQAAMENAAPQAIIHTAALSSVQGCFDHPQLAETINVTFVAQLARWCQNNAVKLLHVSTDMVFDGSQAPYHEQSEIRPYSVYGTSKYRGEQAALEHGAIVVRPALMFGPSLTRNQGFFDQIQRQLQEDQTIKLFDDEWRTPLYYADAAWLIFELLGHPRLPQHIWHIAGRERLSRWQMGLAMKEALQSGSNIEKTSSRSAQFSEPRPSDLSLDTAAIQAFLADFTPQTLDQVYRALERGSLNPSEPPSASD